MSETQSEPQIKGELFLFKKPELMHHEAHGSLGMTKPAKRYDFCSGVRAVPLTVGELASASRDYPIVLISEEQPIPIAAVGLVDDKNLFVDDAGDWERYRYVPGYVRRYPFALAGEEDGDRLAVVIDTDYDGLKAGGEAPLFNGQEATQPTQAAIEFCKSYEEDRLRTIEFGKRLIDLGIVGNMVAQYTPTGSKEPKAFAQYIGIDDQKLRNLSKEKISELHENNMLPIIYSMLTSLHNWRMVLERRATRFGLSEDQILQEQIKS